MTYYLTDGIYPDWATFIQSIRLSQTPKHSLFAKRQESARKDVERAFGVLQASFAKVKNPCLLWEKGKIAYIMRACLILHNMIVEDERHSYTLFDEQEFQVGAQDLTFSNNMATNLDGIGDRRKRIRDKQAHRQLKEDLIENIWTKFGHLPND
ncbi:uncharacterized protein LOC111829435 [Capsella rubella]|uniref:uncharacterized protein LOC111829435 n=1 Tax=Capsella rubella TaxID=81985 RepID=UPI000CD57E1C|nr:uncharacterized protein LOC111829435 [Capsella rubella]